MNKYLKGVLFWFSILLLSSFTFKESDVKNGQVLVFTENNNPKVTTDTHFFGDKETIKIKYHHDNDNHNDNDDDDDDDDDDDHKDKHNKYKYHKRYDHKDKQ